MSYQQCTTCRLWTTVDFYCKYLWNGSSNRQQKMASSTKIFSHSIKIIWWTLVH